MNKTEFFNYERFMSLNGSALCNYAEPFVSTRMDAIPESIYDLLVSDLSRLDEEHTVYALEICMVLKPHEFAHIAIGFLANENASISCAAYNVLSKLPLEWMSSDLRRRITVTPVVDLFTTDVLTGNRICIGTNKEFIRGLVARFSSMSTES